MSEAISEPGSHRPGRHRRGAAASTWTPAVTRHKNGGRHQAAEPAAVPLIAREIDPAGEYGYRAHQRRPATRKATPVAAQVSAPVASVISGMLPLPAGPVETAWPTAEPAEEFASAPARDQAPVPALPAPPAAAVADEFAFAPPEADASDEFAFPWDEDDEAIETGEAIAAQPAVVAAMSADGVPTVKRTKITLTPLTETNDSVRVYAEPRQDGLSTFDLGSVPASVTPPRSWRKAAWFATVSSGGVVVALLVAASYFVGQPSEQVAVDGDGWTGLRGDQGIAEPPPAESSSNSTSSSETTSRTKAQRISDVAGVQSSSERLTVSSSQAAGTTTSGPGGTGPSATATQTASPTTSEPRKPPPSSAPRETNSDQFYRFPPNSETMGDRSEIFLNEITENPERAHEQTGGDLYAEGADGIARRYAHIAYFEIERIYIDQQNRQTVNTVKVVFQDGSTSRQQRTLKFGEGDKITAD